MSKTLLASNDDVFETRHDNTKLDGNNRERQSGQIGENSTQNDGFTNLADLSRTNRQLTVKNQQYRSIIDSQHDNLEHVITTADNFRQELKKAKIALIKSNEQKQLLIQKIERLESNNSRINSDYKELTKRFTKVKALSMQKDFLINYFESILKSCQMKLSGSFSMGRNMKDDPGNKLKKTSLEESIQIKSNTKYIVH